MLVPVGTPKRLKVTAWLAASRGSRATSLVPAPGTSAKDTAWQKGGSQQPLE